MIAALRYFRRRIGRPLVIIWDGLAAHRARPVQGFVAAHPTDYQIEWLPPYAPELNPVEYIWGYWKQHELPNFCPKDYFQLSTQARKALGRMRRRRTLVTAFWKQAELF